MTVVFYFSNSTKKVLNDDKNRVSHLGITGDTGGEKNPKRLYTVSSKILVALLCIYSHR